MKEDYDDDERDGESVLKQTLRLIKDILLLLPRIAISSPARKAYLTTLLLTLASFFLYLTSIAAYALFYYAYIPSPSFSLPIHLDFDASHTHTAHPLGVAALVKPWSPASLSAGQPYDVLVQVTLPRSKANTAKGNFMLDLRLLGQSATYTNTADITTLSPYSPNYTSTLRSAHPSILAHSRRPASLTYRSPLLDLAYKAVFAPLYLVGLKTEVETLELAMMESVSFSRGKGVPRALALEVVAGGGGKVQMQMQIYSVHVTFTARLKGVRWVMYQHRILSFVICTTLFWAIEMAACIMVFGGVSVASYIKKAQKQREIGREEVVSMLKADDGEQFEIKRIKAEEDDESDETEGLSDTSRTFPTFSRQAPLRYSGSAARVKREDEEEDDEREEMLPNVPTTAAEGDIDEDEDEDADFVLEQRFEQLAGSSGGARGFDSGIGSSMDSGSASRRGEMRKRLSRGFD